MKKINQFILGVFLISNISLVHISLVHASDKSRENVLEKPVSNISYSITNIQQYAHSDGYFIKQNNGVEEKVFLGTNHYKAQMEVVHNGKKALLNIMYSIKDPIITNSQETKNNPANIIIGEEVFNEDSIVENKKFKRNSNQEIEKLQSIGLSKEDFDREMRLHFKSVFYL